MIFYIVVKLSSRIKSAMGRVCGEGKPGSLFSDSGRSFSTSAMSAFMVKELFCDRSRAFFASSACRSGRRSPARQHCLENFTRSAPRYFRPYSLFSCFPSGEHGFECDGATGIFIIYEDGLFSLVIRSCPAMKDTACRVFSVYRPGCSAASG